MPNALVNDLVTTGSKRSIKRLLSSYDDLLIGQTEDDPDRAWSVSRVSLCTLKDLSKNLSNVTNIMVRGSLLSFSSVKTLLRSCLDGCTTLRFLDLPGGVSNEDAQFLVGLDDRIPCRIFVASGGQRFWRFRQQ
jgi:hypothetical protein